MDMLQTYGWRTLTFGFNGGPDDVPPRSFTRLFAGAVMVLPSSDPTFATVAQLGAAMRSGELTSRKLVDLHLDRIAQLDHDLNAFIHVAQDTARYSAARLDDELAGGRDRGPLHGIPVAIKDIIDVAGMPTTCGTGDRQGQVVERDAVMVMRLIKAGAIVIGKTNTYEFAYAAFHENFGYTRNPWDFTRTAGATSGGSAAAVAAGLTTVAVGTDAGGSVRIPSAFCGISGMKVSHGAIDLTGAFPSSWTLDHGGAMGRSVGCAATLASVLAGCEGNIEDASFLRHRIGVVRELCDQPCVSPEVRRVFDQACASLRNHDIAVVDVSLRRVLEGNDAMMAILLPEIATIHRERLATHRQEYSPATIAEIEPGLTSRAVDYLRALAFRDELAGAIGHVLVADRLDALVCPTVPWVAPVDLAGPNDEAMVQEGFAAAPFSVAGVPAISIPCGLSENGMPVGMEVIGAPRQDTQILSVAAAIEGLLPPIGRPMVAFT